MKIYAPNEKYNGITAGIQFVDGVAEVEVEETKHIKWLKSKGYKIEKTNKKKEG